MDIYDSERFSEQRTREEAESIAKRVLSESRARKTLAPSVDDLNTNNPTEDTKDKELAIIAELNEKKDEEIEKLFHFLIMLWFLLLI